MIFSKALPTIEKSIGYTFKDKSLITQAFTRSSFCNEAGVNNTYQSNEVLEFIGDSVLSTAIVTKLMSELGERYSHGLKTNLNEGDFSNIKSNLSNKKNLSESMKALGLQKHLIMGKGDATLNIEAEPSVMEDLFESIIGAVYIDCGMNISTVMGVVAKMLDISGYTAGVAANHSAKNSLQEWCAAKTRKLPVPRYETLSEDGPDHKKSYVRACFVGDELVGRGIGKNFKTADAAAASEALEFLMAREQREKAQAEKKAAQEKKAKTTPEKKQKPAQSAAPKIPTDIDPSAPTELREYASKVKLPSPHFKDLGESDVKVDGKQIYRIECRLGDKSTSADAYTKTDARALAAQKLLELLKPKKPQPQKTAPKSKSSAQPQKRAKASQRKKPNKQ